METTLFELELCGCARGVIVIDVGNGYDDETD